MNPTGVRTKQVAKNLTDPFDGFLLRTEYLITDRDGKFVGQSGVAISGPRDAVNNGLKPWRAGGVKWC